MNTRQEPLQVLPTYSKDLVTSLKELYRPLTSLELIKLSPNDLYLYLGQQSVIEFIDRLEQWTDEYNKLNITTNNLMKGE